MLGIDKFWFSKSTVSTQFYITWKLLLKHFYSAKKCFSKKHIKNTDQLGNHCSTRSVKIWCSVIFLKLCYPSPNGTRKIHFYKNEFWLRLYLVFRVGLGPPFDRWWSNLLSKPLMMTLENDFGAIVRAHGKNVWIIFFYGLHFSNPVWPSTHARIWWIRPSLTF